MEQYYEQSVAAEFTPCKRIVYLLCWCMMILCLLLAVVFASFILPDDAARNGISWIAAAVSVAMIVAALCVFRYKDHLRMEYDYIYKDQNLEVYGILNRRRRKKLLSLDINRILSAGSVNAMSQMPKTYKWNAQGGSCCLCYMEGNVRRGALLDLDDNFIAILRRKLPAGAWRDIEGKK